MKTDSVESRLRSAGRFTESAAKLFEDPLSDLTRKHQLWLLVVALITMLLSKRVVTFDRLDIGPFALTLNSQDAVLTALQAICAYLIIIFCADAYRDLRRDAYAAGPVRRELAIEGLQLVPVDGKSIWERRQEIDDRLIAIEAELDEGRRMGGTSALKKAVDLHDERSNLEELLGVLNREINAIAHTTRRIDRLVRYSALIVEIGFPTAFGVASIWLAAQSALSVCGSSCSPVPQLEHVQRARSS